jgi:hypothetical protein
MHSSRASTRSVRRSPSVFVADIRSSCEIEFPNALFLTVVKRHHSEFKTGSRVYRCFPVCDAVQRGRNLIDDEIEFQTAYCCVVLDSKARTDCGWLVVPEDWENPGAQKLKLPVVIYRALNPDPAKAPVIYLSGAPD